MEKKDEKYFVEFAILMTTRRARGQKLVQSKSSSSIFSILIDFQFYFKHKIKGSEAGFIVILSRQSNGQDHVQVNCSQK